MVNEGQEQPCFKDIVDLYRSMVNYNRGYACNNMFVGPGWMNKGGRWEIDYALLLKSCQDGMACYGELKKQGQLQT
jgi:hypothetical protein